MLRSEYLHMLSALKDVLNWTRPLYMAGLQYHLILAGKESGLITLTEYADLVKECRK